MQKNFLHRIKDDSGETIAEVLVAFLLSALAVIMFSTMTSTAMKTTESSALSMGDIYESSSLVVNAEPAGQSVATITLQEYAGQDTNNRTIGTYEVDLYEAGEDEYQLKRFELVPVE